MGRRPSRVRRRTAATVAIELGRWFDVDIRLANTSIAGRRVSAVYNNPSLAGVLEALTATLGLRAEQTGQNDHTLTARP